MVTNTAIAPQSNNNTKKETNENEKPTIEKIEKTDERKIKNYDNMKDRNHSPYKKTNQNHKSENRTNQTNVNHNGNGNEKSVNGFNKKISKQKWVQIPIEIPKIRSKRGRSPRRRRNTDYDDEWKGSDKKSTRQRSHGSGSYRGSRGGGRGGLRSNRRSTQSKQSMSANISHGSRSDNEFPEFSASTMNTEAPPFMMPYMGTYYYNGTGYVGMDSPGVKDCIKKQM